MEKVMRTGKCLWKLDNIGVFLNQGEWGHYLRTAYGNKENVSKNYSVPLCFDIDKMNINTAKKIIDFKSKIKTENIEISQ